MPLLCRSAGARAVVGLAAALVALAAADARADNKAPTPEEVAAARELAKDGVKAARSGDCADAIPKLERARDLYEAPVIPAVALAECLIQTGKVVRGTEILQIVVRTNLGSKPERINVAAKEQARQILDAALPKIAKLVVQVSAPAEALVTVTVDKEPLPKSLLDIDRPSDPGEHLVEASAPGFLPASQSVTLAPGQEATASLTLIPEPAAAKPVARRETPIVAITLLGLGGAGIVTGAVTGALALSTRSTLNGECPGHQCGPAAAGDLTSLKSLSWASTLAFVVGIGCAGAGGTLLLLRASSDAPKTTGLRMTPSLGPGWVGVMGEFQ